MEGQVRRGCERGWGGGGGRGGSVRPKMTMIERKGVATIGWATVKIHRLLSCASSGSAWQPSKLEIVSPAPSTSLERLPKRGSASTETRGNASCIYWRGIVTHQTKTIRKGPYIIASPIQDLAGRNRRPCTASSSGRSHGVQPNNLSNIHETQAGKWATELDHEGCCVVVNLR